MGTPPKTVCGVPTPTASCVVPNQGHAKRQTRDPTRLKVNETKSAAARPEERKFPGFSISNDGIEWRIAPKALDKFKERIRELTSRTRGLSLPQIIEELTPYLIGWRSYFGFCRPLARSRSWRRGPSPSTNFRSLKKPLRRRMTIRNLSPARQQS
jgi:hypothetical protein